MLVACSLSHFHEFFEGACVAGVGSLESEALGAFMAPCLLLQLRKVEQSTGVASVDGLLQ
ncbi:hypothetical protein [Streptomyces sp. NBC_01750]|uniref:hypothetical protein n=1 Tax=Streptomyces sp. NBC_01750 TaxID=2975928 RepID=UPI002DD8AF6B|nr:hypothetical protein [Streptomyces sp. NBC_01750]WSD30602.1 hypothetical protein OG966_00545 [Streptomyces sp. NBC_01750]